MPVQGNDILKVTLQGNMLGAASFQNVFHVRWEAPDDCDNLVATTQITVWVDDFLGQLDDILTTAISWSLVKVYNETQDQPVGDAVPSVGAGSVASDPLPSGVAAVVSLYTGFKRTVGKKFIAGFPEAATTAGEWGGATLGALASLAGYWIGPQQGDPGYTFTCCTWNTVKRVAHDIVAGVVRSVPGYQRRRKAGVGI